MKTYTLADVAELVDKYNDIINLGSEDDEENETDDLPIEKAEKALGLQFTSSYKVFLKNYGGGEICGEEIYSLSREPQYYTSNFYVKELRIMQGA